jgi:hypothetical protein
MARARNPYSADFVANESISCQDAPGGEKELWIIEHSLFTEGNSLVDKPLVKWFAAFSLKSMGLKLHP